MRTVRGCTWALVAALLALGVDRAAAQTVSSNDILYILPHHLNYSSVNDATFANDVAELRSRLSEGSYVKVGFTLYVSISMDAWDVNVSDQSAVRAALASTIGQIDTAIARARAHGIPVALSLVTALRSSTDAAQTASQTEDIRSMQWYSDNGLATGWWTHSRYARKQRAVQEAYIREVGRVIADRMRQFPETLVAATGDGEVELSYDRAPQFFADYSPFSVTEFRDWIRLGGLYAAGGTLAGQAYELGSRYAGDQSPAQDTNSDGHTLNGDFGTTFQTWDLLHFNWSLADAYMTTDPRAIPFAQYSSASWVKLPGATPGGFDAPRTPSRGNPWWELWMLFKQRMIWRHNQEFAKWITTSPDAFGYFVPRERWYSDQIPADYLFGGTPENPNERFFSSASAWWTADVSPYGSLGITAFNIDFGSGNIARTLINVVPRILERGLRWGVIEWHPGLTPAGTVASSLELFRSEMALVEQYRPSLIVPFAWGDPGYRIQDTGFETALREMIDRIRNQAPGLVGASPSSIRFGAVKNGVAGPLSAVTSPQDVTITFSGASTAWTASSDQPWLQLSSASATGNGRLVAAVVNPNNVIGGSTWLSATITIRPIRAGSPSTSIPVTLAVRQSSTTSQVAAFGSFDTPSGGGSALDGSIAVTGWALDDIGVDRVEIWRDLVPGETTTPYQGPGHPGHGKVFIANGLFVSGARPDVELTYGSFPQSHRAGWGYLLLTWGLWNQGNGTYTLYAFAFDKEGSSTTLGTKTIQVNNRAAAKPFGGIDTPGYGQTVSGGFWNYGWALTPSPNSTDPRTCAITNGNVLVSVDSGPLVAVSYGDQRPDIAASFPGFSNGGGAGGAYYIDTTTLTNGTHQIGWYVVDNCGRADGIGSRFFTVLNGSSVTAADRDAQQR